MATNYDPDNPPRRMSTTKVTALVVIFLFMLICVPGVMLPAFTRYMVRAKTTEAIDRLAYLYRMSATYATTTRAGADGTAMAPQFPMSAPLTPAAVPLAARVVDPNGTWSHPTWQALSFSVTDPHYYSYQYDSDGAHFTARALGDLDGDRVLSTFERAGEIGADQQVNGSQGVWMNRELE